MISLAEARAFVLASCPPSPTQVVPLDDALGCVVPSAIVASEPVPSFVNSSMDGFALRASDTAAATPTAPCRLSVVGTVLAGSDGDVSVGEGQAVRIMTGAPLPDGTDSVAMQEVCRSEGNDAVGALDDPVVLRSFVRTVGEDVEVGQVVVDAGTALTPGHLGSLANQGVAEVVVHPRPRVGVLSTGDELVGPAGPLSRGKIRDANRHSLLGLVRLQGWDAVDLGMVTDDATALEAVFDAADTRCDAVITSGGVSVGEADVVKAVLRERCGASMGWMQVAIRPAKPLAFGILSRSGLPVFGLPGNPVSAMVSFELFVRPAVRRMGGHSLIDHVTVPATADAPYRRGPDGKTHFVRSVVTLDRAGRWRVRPLDGQGSHQLSAMAESNALAVVTDGPGVEPGDTVPVLVVAPERVTVSEAPA